MNPLRADFHLSDDALRAAESVSIGGHDGVGSYRRRKAGLQARVEAAVELERRAGRLFTPEDIHRFLERQLMICTGGNR